MRHIHFALCATSFLAAIVGSSDALPAPAAGNYQLIEKIPVAGDGSWDYLSIDADSR